MAQSRAAGSVVIPFEQLRATLGKLREDAAVKALLARAGRVVVPEKSRGHLLVARDAGFDLFAHAPKGARRNAPPEVYSVTLYREGIATPRCPARSRDQYVHRQYGTPPFGLGFVPRAELLARMPPPRETLLWGTGPVAVDAPAISYDEWIIEGLQVWVHYSTNVPHGAPAASAVVEHIDFTRETSS